MKNMMFIFRGLVKLSLLLVLTLSAQSLVAQDANSELFFSTSSASKDTPSLANANYVSANEAVTNLDAAANAIRSNTATPTTEAQKLDREVVMNYYRYISIAISEGSTISQAIQKNYGWLNNALTKTGASISAEDIQQQALDLVSN